MFQNLLVLFIFKRTGYGIGKIMYLHRAFMTKSSNAETAENNKY